MCASCTAHLFLILNIKIYINSYFFLLFFTSLFPYTRTEFWIICSFLTFSCIICHIFYFFFFCMYISTNLCNFIHFLYFIDICNKRKKNHFFTLIEVIYIYIYICRVIYERLIFISILQKNYTKSNNTQLFIFKSNISF